MKHYFALLACLTAGGMTSGSLAQSLSLPSTADPSRVEEQLQPVPTAPNLLQEEIPLDASGVETPAGAQDMAFTLNEMHIRGMTVYKHEEISNMYQHLIGKNIALSEIYAVAQQLTVRYREDGYVLTKVTVPSQTIEDGIAEIQVTEGYISQIERNGEQYDSAIVDGIIKKISQSNPLNIRDLERGLLLLNDLAGVQARGYILPDKAGEKPGAVSLAIQFEDRPFVQNISMDNYGTRYLGPYQLGARLGHNHLLFPYQQTIAAAYTSINLQELHYYYLSHSVPVHRSGTKIRVTGSYSDTKPGYRLQESDVKGDSFNVSVDVTQPLKRSREENIHIYSRLDWVHSTTDILNTELFEDELRVLRIGFNYDGSDNGFGSNFVSAELSQGIDILGASDEEDLNLSRSEGSGSFSKLTISLARLQGITDDIDCYIATSGQWADGTLLSSEEFGYGGRNFGRGYDSSEITGDHGVSGLLELRYNGVPEKFSIKPQLYAFYDAGKVWNEDLGSENASGTSTGLGVRFNVDNGLSGDVGVSLPLTRERSAPTGAHAKDPQLYFSLNLRF